MAIGNKIKTPHKRFINLGIAEGWSYIILVFVGMPLKYYAEIPDVVRIVGMIHGVLFVGFVAMLAYVSNFYGWKAKTTIFSFILSLVPFGTFFLKKITQDAV